jgi:phage terminase small subunit
MANLTQKREAFCLAYIETGNQSEAYRAAFDAENMKAETVHKRASELMANGGVRGRIAELQAQAVERALVSVQSLTEELEEARALALREGQPSAAVSASMGKAKLHGLLVDKAELTGKDGAAIQLEQVKNDAQSFARSIAGLASRAGTSSQD